MGPHCYKKRPYSRFSEGSYRLKKCFRLTKNFEFMRVYKKGRRAGCPLFSMYAKENQLGYSRLGISVRKKTGKSVVRNRIKRRIREAFRTNMENVKKGYDIVVSVKEDAREADFNEIKRSLIYLLKKLNLWTGNDVN